MTKLMTNRVRTVKAVAEYAVHTEARNTSTEMSARERQLLAILDHSPNLVFVKDPEGRYLFVNRRFSEVFHLTREQITGKTDRDLFPPGQAAAFRLNDRKVLEAGIPLEFEEVAQHDDGPHTSIVFKFPLCDTEGRTYAIGGITTDITDRKGMEHALRESQARLALALDARQQLDADLHDNIIQMLYAVGMNLEQSRHLLHYNVTAADDTLKGALSNLNHVIEDVRGYIGRQEPPRLCGNQLIATLSGLLCKWIRAPLSTLPPNNPFTCIPSPVRPSATVFVMPTRNTPCSHFRCAAHPSAWKSMTTVSALNTTKPPDWGTAYETCRCAHRNWAVAWILMPRLLRARVS
jgi:PAS domain S-box-containing protein